MSNLKWQYLAVGPYAWGRGESIDQARRRCVENIGVKLDDPHSAHVVVFEVFSDDVGINDFGGLSWPSDSRAPVVAWMGSEYSSRNPGRFVGQSLGGGGEQYGGDGVDAIAAPQK